MLTHPAESTGLTDRPARQNLRSGEDEIMTRTAIAAVERLVDQFGLDAVIDAVLEEAECAPDDQLGALEQMIDALMAGFIAEAETHRGSAAPRYTADPPHPQQKKLSGS